MTASLSRRHLLAAAIATGALPAFAADPWPTKPLRIVVPFAPGGGADTWSRLLGQRLSDEIGQPVIMDSRPGARGVIGSRLTARGAPADGYTLLFGTDTNITLGPLTMKEPGFDFTTDLVPVMGLNVQPLFIVVPANSPFTSAAQLVETGRKSDNKLSYGSTGTGSLTHVSGLALNAGTGTSLLHVPYKGGAPLGLAVLTGEVSCAFMIGNDAMPHVRSGKLRLLAVAAPARSRFVPDVPTLREAGVSGVPDLTAWFAYFVRAGTPQPVVDGLHRRMVKYLDDPAVRTRLDQSLAEPWPVSPAELMAALRTEVQLLGPVIKAAGVTTD